MDKHSETIKLQDQIEALKMKVIKLEKANQQFRRDIAVLKENETKLTELQRIASINSWRVSSMTGKLKCSDGIMLLTGRENDVRMNFDDLLQLFHPADREKFKKRYDESQVSGHPFEMEHRLILADGQERIVNHYCKTYLTDMGMPLKTIGLIHDITERKQAEEDREKLIKKLQKALEEIKTLKGIIPICASCKKIRDDRGYWKQIESYIQEHSEAEFSHSICQECTKKLYPDLVDEDGNIL